MAKIRLIPNPYCYIDAQGRAVGTHPHVPGPHVHEHRRIGAKVAGSVKPVANPIAGEMGKAYAAAGNVPQMGGHFGLTPILQDTTWEYATEPEETENSPDGFYARACMAGDLFAADRESAEIMGIPYRDPYELLALARAKAAATFQANHGKVPAFMSEPCKVAGSRGAVTKVGDAQPPPVGFEETHSTQNAEVNS